MEVMAWNQQKPLLLSFATNAYIHPLRNSQTLEQYVSYGVIQALFR